MASPTPLTRCSCRSSRFAAATSTAATATSTTRCRRRSRLDVMRRRIDHLAGLGTSVVAFSGGEPMLHPRSRPADPAHPVARHDGRADHERLLPGPEADPGAQRGGARLPADQHRQRRAGRGFEEEPACPRSEAASGSGARRVRREHQFRARRRHQEPRRRAGDQHARARELGFSTSHRHHSRRRRIAEAAGAGRAAGVRRGHGRDQRPVAGVQEPLLGHPELPGQPRRRPAQRVALPRGRALPVRLRGRPRPLLLPAARLPAIPLERYTIDDIRREFATPKGCAPYCTVGCVHRVSTMDFWRRPQRQDGGPREPEPAPAGERLPILGRS